MRLLAVPERKRKIRLLLDMLEGNIITMEILDPDDDKPFRDIETGKLYSYDEAQRLEAKVYFQGEEQEVIEKYFQILEKNY